MRVIICANMSVNMTVNLCVNIWNHMCNMSANIFVNMWKHDYKHVCTICVNMCGHTCTHVYEYYWKHVRKQECEHMCKHFFVIGLECPQRLITWVKNTDIPLRVSIFSVDLSCSFLPFFLDSLPHWLPSTGATYRQPLSLCGLGGPLGKMGTSVHGPEIGLWVLVLLVIVRVIFVSVRVRSSASRCSHLHRDWKIVSMLMVLCQ